MIFGEINPTLWAEEVEWNKNKFGKIKDPFEMSTVDLYV